MLARVRCTAYASDTNTLTSEKPFKRWLNLRLNNILITALQWYVMSNAGSFEITRVSSHKMTSAASVSLTRGDARQKGFGRRAHNRQFTC